MNDQVNNILELKDVDSYYGELQVLSNISLSVGQNEVVAIFGPNGHGKSTLLKAISGLYPPRSGSIRLNETEIAGMRCNKIVAKGVALIPEDRHLFPEMTVQENLVMGAYNRSARRKISENLEMVYSLFPRLSERTYQAASTLSGGEARMVAVGRGLMSDASLLLIDEPSIGLSPLMKQAVFDALEKIKAQGGFSVLIVEQEVDYPLSVADRVYLMRKGRIVLERQATEISKSEIEDAYF